MKYIIGILMVLGASAFGEKVYRTLGMNSTQSPNQKFRALLDTSGNEIKIMDMRDSAIVDGLKGCGSSPGNLAIWMSDSLFIFLDERGDSISLFAYGLDKRILIQFGKQHRYDQNFSRTVVALQNRGLFSLGGLKEKYPDYSISKNGCE